MSILARLPLGPHFNIGPFFEGNLGAPGATVSWSGAASGSAEADAAGNYHTPSLVNGAYTLTPSLFGYTFTPPTATGTLAGSPLVRNFAATGPTVPSVVSTTPGPPIGRDPVISLRWSDDGGHTWSNSYDRSFGAAGEYKTRVIWRRLGRARDRIFEISVSDPVPARIVDGYAEFTGA